jgi:hypothetical protein
MACGSTALVANRDGGEEAGSNPDTGTNEGDANPDTGIPTPDAGLDATTSDTVVPDVGTDADGSLPPSDAGLDALPECGPAPIQEAGAPMTVSGMVLSSNDVPLPELGVTIQGQTTTTAADGTFSLAGVTPPYDLVIDDVGLEAHFAYLGLTRTDPVLITDIFSGTSGHASVDGTMTLGGVPWMATTMSQFGGVVLDMTSAPNGDISSSPIYSGSVFQTYPDWTGTQPASGTLWGFAGTTLPSGGVASFDAVGTLPVTVDAGAMITGLDLAIAPGAFPATKLSGTLALPPGCFPSATLQLDGDSLSVDYPAADAGAFSYATFSGAVTWNLGVQCSFPIGSCIVTRSGLIGSEVLSIQVPTPQTTPIAPASTGFVNPACVDFAWTATPGAVYSVRLSMSGPTYTIFTAGTSFRLPFVLPTGAYNWTLNQGAGFASLDDATASYAAGAQLLDVTVSNVNSCSEQDGFSVP